MAADAVRYAQARDHLNRLVSLYATIEDDEDNCQILRDIEWLVQHMAEMSAEEFLDTVAPDDETAIPQQSPSSGSQGRKAA